MNPARRFKQSDIHIHSPYSVTHNNVIFYRDDPPFSVDIVEKLLARSRWVKSGVLHFQLMAK
jgi:hypothetical protein